MARTVTAAVIVIGTEILTGRTKDVNLGFVAERLAALGVRLREARVVPDEEAAIIAAVNACRKAYDYVFTTGGIGPTHDDITARAVARAFEAPLERNLQAVALLEAHYRETGRELNAARLKMAEMPKGARLVPNAVSKAPGFQIENVFVFAGLPAIMQAMFMAVEDRLQRGTPVCARTLIVHLPEGTVAAGLEAVQNRFPGVEIGSYPFYGDGVLGTNLVLRSTDATRLDDAIAAVKTFVAGLGAQALEGEAG
ncbi:MAG: competence/damage-inducible protein A [Alphaproteobacteria bacterium]